jgi:hypothetical protein
MKPIIIALIAIVLAACNKPTVAPDLAEPLQGNYEITYYQSGSTIVRLPQNGVTGIISVSRNTANSIIVSMAFYQNSRIASSNQFPTFFLKQVGSYTAAYVDGEYKTQIATFTGRNFEINQVDNTGTRIVIQASK